MKFLRWLLAMKRPKGSDPRIDAAVAESEARAEETHRLIRELRDARLARARLMYEERLHGSKR